MDLIDLAGRATLLSPAIETGTNPAFSSGKTDNSPVCACRRQTCVHLNLPVNGHTMAGGALDMSCSAAFHEQSCF
jgi:hypothetical protein